MIQQMTPASTASQSLIDPVADVVSATDPSHLVGVERSTQPLLPGMESHVRDAVVQCGRRHDVESAFQQVTATMKPLLTKKETAEFYTVSQRTIDRWLMDGTLPLAAKVVIGGSVRYRTDFLLRSLGRGN